MNEDATWDRWAHWLGREPSPGTIHHDVVGMQASRQIWQRLQAVVSVSPEEARQLGTFHSWVNGIYLRSQGLAIRRQVDRRTDVICLRRLLGEIEARPDVISRARYIAKLHPADARRGEEFFDQLVRPGAEALEKDRPTADIARLDAAAGRIRKWVDKEVAHYDRAIGKFSEGLTVREIHTAVDLIFEVFNYYQRLLLGQSVAGEVVMPPWERVFRVAWIPDDEALNRIIARGG